ncbi:DUF4304 domain-containing protein [Rhodobacter sp. SY28-1]|uniref:DUF4304 domain-containing protein n=1 Tax=Rhodobacter sp. SY28-1 TaxID=2562317 RepID=UPI0010C060EE|nr:DUF4304 domain-containing protein [Rhodobacter sp. SY28-1]
MTDRAEMIAVLKRSCVPVLRDMGFQGTFPHFYREDAGFVDLVTFQFGREGGCFCVNLGQADRRWWTSLLLPKVAPDKLRFHQTRGWVRLGAIQGDRWFVYDPEIAVLRRSAAQTPDEIAALCAELFLSHAEPWWAQRRSEARVFSGRSRPPRP